MINLTSFCHPTVTVSQSSLKRGGNGLFLLKEDVDQLIHHKATEEEEELVLASVPLEVCVVVGGKTSIQSQRIQIMLSLIHARLPNTSAASQVPPSICTYISSTLASLSFNTPVFWPLCEIHMLLKGTELLGATLSKLKRLERELTDLQQTSDTPISLDLWKWADAVFWSRSLLIKESTYALVPFIDFANHSFQPNARWQLDEDQRAIHLLLTKSPQSDHHQQKQLQQQQEIFISYGDKPNSELLFIHGFVVKDNPHDRVLLEIPLLEQQQAGSGDKSFIQAKINLLKSANPIYPNIALNFTESKSNYLTRIPSSSLLSLLLSATFEEDGLAWDQNHDNWSFRGISFSSASDLLTLLAESSDGFLDVVQLRICTLLLDAIVYHVNEMSFDVNLGVEISGEEGHAHRVSLAESYKQSVLQIFEISYTELETKKQQLEQSDSVLKYLT